jgi:hypothetical protein
MVEMGLGLCRKGRRSVVVVLLGGRERGGVVVIGKGGKELSRGLLGGVGVDRGRGRREYRRVFRRGKIVARGRGSEIESLQRLFVLPSVLLISDLLPLRVDRV